MKTWFIAWALVLGGLFVGCADDERVDGGGGSGGTSGNTSAGATSAAGAPDTGSAGDSGDVGGSSPGGASGNPADVTAAASFWSGFAEAVCRRDQDCIRDDQGERTAQRLVLGERCVELVESLILARPRVMALNQAVELGLLTVQPEAVERCLELASRCDYQGDDVVEGTRIYEDVTVCREVFEGSVAEGDGCDLSEECAGDSMCVRSDEAVAAGCAGTCAPRLAEGEACTSPRQCAADDEHWPSCETVCLAREIPAPGQPGEPCTFDRLFNSCEHLLMCSNVCAPPIALEEACDLTADPPTRCLEGRCTENVCTAWVVQTEADTACGPNDQICDPYSSLTCVDDVCVETDFEPGSPCGGRFWFEEAFCPPPALLGAGLDCTTADECESGICRSPGGCAEALCNAP